MENIVDQQYKSKLNFKVKISTITILIIVIILFVAAYFNNSENFGFTIIICLFGAVLGWLVAMLITPYGKSDKSSLENFSKIAGSFLTGYVLSKLDNIIETFVNNREYTDELICVRLFLFLSFFFCFWILVFNYRTYVILDPQDLAAKNEEKINLLNDWKDLLDKNVITKEDYNFEKHKILKTSHNSGLPPASQ